MLAAIISPETSRFTSRFAVLLVGVAALTGPGSSQASSVRVPADFYGVNFQRIKDVGPQARETRLGSMAGLGIDQVD